MTVTELGLYSYRWVMASPDESSTYETRLNDFLREARICTATQRTAMDEALNRFSAAAPADSQLAVDTGTLSGRGRRTEARRAIYHRGWRLAFLMAANVGDHLQAVGDVAVYPPRVFAHMSLSRAALEGAARTHYLLCPSGTSSDRVLRSAALLLASAQHEVTAAGEMSIRPGLNAMAVAAAKRRHDEISRLLERADIKVHLGKRHGRALGVGWSEATLEATCSPNITAILKPERRHLKLKWGIKSPTRSAERQYEMCGTSIMWGSGGCTRHQPTKGLDMSHGPDAGHAREATRLAVRAVLLAALIAPVTSPAVAAVASPAVAAVASVAYLDKGEVWLASLDGTKKARLAMPVVNGDGDTENWLDIAQSDGGRIVAVRNKPDRSPAFSWFKIWEPDGTSTVEGPLNAPSGWSSYAYPLGFDITADGSHLVYGYSNSGACCPIAFGRGTYVRPATNSALNPIDTSSQTSPSLFGSRVISLENSSSPTVINVQNADGGNPYTNSFTPWLDTSGIPLDLEGVDVAANGRLAALGFETWNGGTQTVGRIAVLAIQGVDQPPESPASVDCFLPAAGIARDASLAQDAGAIAWKDDGGVKVAGSPSTAADPCVMGSAPVVLSPTGTHPSIGGADVAAFLPKPPVMTGPGATTLAAGAVASWTGTDAIGVSSYDMRYRTAAWNRALGGYHYPSHLQKTAARSTTQQIALGALYCMSVRARDAAGNVSSWSAERCTAKPLDDRSLRTKGAWAQTRGKAFFAGTIATTTAKGASLTRVGALSGRVALIASKGKRHGTVGIYYNGKLVKKVNLATAKTRTRQVIALPRLAKKGTIVVKVLTTRKTVKIDGLLSARL